MYEIKRPNYCCGCGESLNTISQSKISSAETNSPETEDAAMPDVDIRKLRRDIVVEASSRKTSLIDLWKSAPPTQQPPLNYNRPAPNLPDGSELLKINQQQCSSSRTIDIDE